MGADNTEMPLSSPVEASPQERNALPQYGFGADIGFEQLIDSNPFLFRVHTPKEPSPFYDNTEPYFVGQAFQDSVGALAFRPSTVSPYQAPSTHTYADVSKHMDWTTKASSPYVSTSFSFAWAIWEATRRYHHGMKHGVEIAIIDAKALSGKAVTAVELLHQGARKDRHPDHWKWWRYAHEAQDVLVWGYIPGTVVLASIPLTQILSKLPSYFLNPDPSVLKDTPISRVGWEYERKKYSYRMFCQDMSERFLRMPVDRRVRDTTAGAVRLAITLLRPWFHRLATDDFTTATAVACDLAQCIARWPGLWWVREHPEIKDLIRCLVHIVGEEAREARRTQALADATRMQDIVGGLEQLARTFHERPDTRSARSSFTMASTSSTASVVDEDETKVDRDLASFVLKPILTEEGKSSFQVVRPPVFSPPVSSSSSKLAPPPESVKPAEEAKVDNSVSASGAGERQTAKGKEKANDGPHVDKVTSPISPIGDVARRFFGSTLGAATGARAAQSDFFSKEFYARTASTFLTGFFLGTFITLCMLSPQRREIANHFT
ncbi:hypothetical protein BD309DRAFT_860434 [Dichomitus squalens]|nr:hypothetical protein BD309DRAFT_860434 [Dichomitus squalens]